MADCITDLAGITKEEIKALRKKKKKKKKNKKKK